MKVFSSIVTLLLASTAAAQEAHDIIARPHVAKAISVIKEAGDSAEEDIACYDEFVALVDCLGAKCVDCVISLVEDLEEDVTCQELEDSTFCGDMMTCVVSHCIDDSKAPDYCMTEGEALDDCAEAEYPDEYDDDEDCPDLCMPGTTESSGDEKKEISIKATKRTHSVSEIVTHPKVAPLVAAYSNLGEHEEPVPCEDELVTLFECMGDGCINCIIEIFSDFEEDVTCAELEADGVCGEIHGCATGVCTDDIIGNNCLDEGEALLTCAENLPIPSSPSASSDEGCPDLCVDVNVAKVFAIA